MKARLTIWAIGVIVLSIGLAVYHFNADNRDLTGVVLCAFCGFVLVLTWAADFYIDGQGKSERRGFDVIVPDKNKKCQSGDGSDHHDQNEQSAH